MRRLRVLLDANVIVNAQVRDLICRLAEAELLDVRWSAAILEETRRALVEGLGLDPYKVDRLLGVLDRAFPAASVEGFEELIDQLELPDLDDRHVLAAAIHGECDLLVTDNVSDFPPATMECFDILALTADDAIALLATQFREQMTDIIEDQIVALRRPAMTRDEFLARLAQQAPKGAAALRSILGWPRR